MENHFNLRFVFVEMLFALAIGQVAIEVGDLILKGASLINYNYVYSHLLLGTIIISASWVGWKTAKTPGNIKSITSVFSWQFIILLIDIFLVICYFIIVRGAEIYYKETSLTNSVPSSYNETFWSMIIFISYLIWDIFSELDATDYEQKGNGYIKKSTSTFKHFFNNAWQALICLLISLCIFMFMNKYNSANKVATVDFALCFLFLLFRGLKQKIDKEYFLIKENVPESILRSSNLNAATFPLKIIEENYWPKVLITRAMPFLLLLVTVILYFK